MASHACQHTHERTHATTYHRQREAPSSIRSQRPASRHQQHCPHTAVCPIHRSLQAAAHGTPQTPQALPSDQLSEWDVVEYTHSQAQPHSSGSPAGVRLGLVQQVDAAAVRVSPLIEEDEGVWVPEADDAESPEQQEQVSLDRVLRIVETVYGQRQDKEHNPHGEHAHDVWQVVVPLSPWVFKGPPDGTGGGGSGS